MLNKIAVVVLSPSRVHLFATPWTAAHQASLFITNYQSLLKLIHHVNGAIQPSHPLSSPSPSAFNLSQHQDSLFKWVSSSHLEKAMAPHSSTLAWKIPWMDEPGRLQSLGSLRVGHDWSDLAAVAAAAVLPIRWPKYWSFSFSISPSNEYSGLISFRIDWFDLLAVQGTVNNLLQHHGSKASILLHSAFFIVQLSHPYSTTGKTMALTRWIFVDKVMSLLFNMLSRFVIAFLPRSKCLLISWLQSPSAVSLSPFPLCPHLFAMKWWD